MPSSLYRSLMQPDLRIMLKEDDTEGMNAFFETMYPGLAAEIMEDMESSEIWAILKHGSWEQQAEVFQFFSLLQQIELVELIDRDSLSKIIEHMAPDDRVDLLERMDHEHVEALLPLIAQAERNDIRRLLSYDEGSAGSIMTTEYASLPADITATEAIHRLRLQAPSRETIYYIYITDAQRHVAGFLSLRELILAKPDAKLSQLMERDVIRAKVTDDQETVANDIIRFGFIAMPVVDDEDRLVGIITHDDAAEVMQEEATEDAQRMAAVSPLEDGYLETGILTLAWKRGVWLLVLVAAALGTVTVLNHSPLVAWMVMFIPLIAASGGNSGSQSATLVIRMLAIEEARGDTHGLFGRVFRREVQLALALGLPVSLLAFALALMFVPPGQALVVGVTVFLVVAFGAISGAMLPLILHSMKLDPALMSNPMLAAIVDVVGLLVYITVAMLLL